jgi:hypothetical protein
LGTHAFLLVAPDPDPSLPQAGTQISLHQSHLRDEREASAYRQLAAQLGFLRLSGYRMVMQRSGMRSKINLMNPADVPGGGDHVAGTLIFSIPDCQAAFDHVKDAGAEVEQEPTNQPYGVIDCSFLDPNGNHVRFSQVL